MILFNKYLKNYKTGEEINNTEILLELHAESLKKVDYISDDLLFIEACDVEEAWKRFAVSDDKNLNEIALQYKLVIEPVEE